MRFPATPLFLQALGLVVAALVAAEIATVVVVLNLPPPAPDIYSVADVIQAVRHDGRVQTPDGRDLDTRFVSIPPTLTTEGRRRLQFRDALSQALAIPAADVVISQKGPRIVALGGAQKRLDARLAGQRESPYLLGDFEVSIRQPDGRWRVVAPELGFAIDPWERRLLLVLAIAAIAVAPLAWWFARRLAAPISALAAGAERLGRDPSAPRLDIRGSAEVTLAVIAFNEMQERLRQYVDDRTGMIAAIAHDLRTPLTRLRFRIEAAPEEVRAKLAADIDQMEAMVSATLAFVRDASRPRERVKLEIASLVETIMDEAAETGADSAAEASDRVVVDGDPVALRRLITNLVDNALKFGSSARGRVFAEDGMAIVEIDDNGPGIAEDQIERAFEPFHRLETSRNRDTGGIGLGLAVVRAIAKGHGGDVSLRPRPGGGLSARVRLPLALPPSRLSG
ncbi:MAG TPA: ATP-binding protein [Caulobacteraceae bacterium]|jgi:signal transduction histidine kinase|nr:ATP-binding protein [Caulobacteraceae bacterium]